MLENKSSNTVKHINRGYNSSVRESSVQFYSQTVILYIVPSNKKFEGYISQRAYTGGTLKINGTQIPMPNNSTSTINNGQMKIYLDAGDVLSFRSDSNSGVVFAITGVEF